MQNSQAIVVTGMGALSPNGLGLQAFWENTLAGVSGISRISRLASAGQANQFGGEIGEFDLADYLEFEVNEPVGRAAKFALATARMALHPDTAFRQTTASIFRKSFRSGPLPGRP